MQIQYVVIPVVVAILVVALVRFLTRKRSEASNAKKQSTSSVARYSRNTRAGGTSRPPVSTPAPLAESYVRPAVSTPRPLAETPSQPSSSEIRMRIQNATTVDECLDAAAELPDVAAIQALAESKIDQLLSARLAKANTIEQCFEVYADCPEDEDDAIDDVIGNKILDKALVLATSYESVIEFLETLTRKWTNEPYELKALAKAVPLATTFDEMTDIDDRFRGNYEDEGLEKAIFERLMDVASSVEDYEAIRQSYLPDTEDPDADERVVKKLLPFVEDVEGCETIWDEFGIDTPSGKAAIVRAAEIIRKEDSLPSPTVADEAPVGEE